MKKFLLLLMAAIICILFTSCTLTESYTLTLTYDEESRNCTLKNISSNDYGDLKITMILYGQEGFEKEITREIGDFKEGQEAVFKITEIGEDVKLLGVALKSYNSNSGYSGDFDFAVFYDKESKTCILKNISTDNCDEFEPTLVLHGKDGFEKRITRELEGLDEGGETVIEITEETEVQSVTLESYDYDDFMLTILSIVLLAILLTLLMCLMYTIFY